MSRHIESQLSRIEAALNKRPDYRTVAELSDRELLRILGLENFSGTDAELEAELDRLVEIEKQRNA